MSGSTERSLGEASPATMDRITVHVAFDAEVRVWYVAVTAPLALAGLNLEAETFEALADQIPNAVADLYAADNRPEQEVDIEIVSHGANQSRRHLHIRPPHAA
jgi:Domain of unknown function (DUF1902)